RVAAPSRDPLADAFEVFESDPATGASGGFHEPFRDDVMLMAAEPGFLVPQPPDLFLAPLGLLPLESVALELVLLPDLLDIGSGVGAPSLSAAMFLMPRSTPMKSSGSMGVSSGTSTVTNRNHWPSL